MQVIKVACGNHYCASSVGYHYVGVFLYTSRIRKKDGCAVFGPGKLIAGPYRSKLKADRVAKTKAEELGIEYRPGYGSLYGQDCTISSTALTR